MLGSENTIAKKTHKNGLKSLFYSRCNIQKIIIVSFIFGTFVFTSFFYILNPKLAEAGFFDFLIRTTKAEFESQTDLSQNVQTMNILEAPLVREPKSSLKDVGIFFEENTLFAEVGPNGSIADIYEESESGEISVYEVREGDTLDSISKLFGVSVNTIKWANDLKNNSVKIGTQLTILPVSGISHTVQSGDTISSIAKRYKASADEIISFNDLEDKKINIGMRIIIPDGEMPLDILNSKTKSKQSVQNSKLPEYTGYFIRPTVGIRTRGVKPGHKGVDIANKIGTPIYAAASGKVIVADDYGYNGGFGKYVVISHPNGSQTLYGHLSAVETYVGEFVEQGEIIGKMGNTGRSTGPHLHFEVRGAKNPF